ncbi:MAG TPA: hypothetical protein VGO60_03495 [Iamia sp.]|jgi:hypothetical protein|nr:hypothetical protein [Iamia sp.]
MRYRPLLAGAAALALTLSLVACGDDDGDDTADTSDTTEAEASTDATTADTEATEDTTADTEATEDTEATDDTEAGEPAGDLSTLLVTPEAVGEGFTEQPYETSTEGGPCGAMIDEEYPFDAIVGTVLVEEELELALQQEIRTYADAATAEETFNYAQEALSCGAETTTEGLVLGEVTDVTDSIGADAFAVEVTAEADGTEGALVVVLVGPALSVFQFQGPADVDDGPDPVAIVAENTTALQAELG